MARKLSQDLQDWIAARKRHHLSHAHVQMARELGMNPKKLGKLDNHDQEPWKAPLAQFIEHLYEKTFGRAAPAHVMSIEDRARAQQAKRAARKQAKAARKQAERAAPAEPGRAAPAETEQAAPEEPRRAAPEETEQAAPAEAEPSAPA